MELFLFIVVPCTVAVALCLAYIQIQTWVDEKQLAELENYKRERRTIKVMVPPNIVTHTSSPPVSDAKDKFVKDMWKRYHDTHPTKSHD